MKNNKTQTHSKKVSKNLVFENNSKNRCNFHSSSENQLKQEINFEDKLEVQLNGINVTDFSKDEIDLIVENLDLCMSIIVKARQKAREDLIKEEIDFLDKILDNFSRDNIIDNHCTDEEGYCFSDCTPCMLKERLNKLKSMKK